MLLPHAHEKIYVPTPPAPRLFIPVSRTYPQETIFRTGRGHARYRKMNSPDHTLQRLPYLTKQPT